MPNTAPIGPTINRRPAVTAATGYPRSTLYKKIEDGLFTRPVKLGARAVGWPSHETAAISAARIAGHTEVEIRALVKTLHANRRKAT